MTPTPPTTTTTAVDQVAADACRQSQAEAPKTKGQEQVGRDVPDVFAGRFLRTGSPRQAQRQLERHQQLEFLPQRLVVGQRFADGQGQRQRLGADGRCRHSSSKKSVHHSPVEGI